MLPLPEGEAVGCAGQHDVGVGVTDHEEVEVVHHRPS
jgi:hypothetical protein